MICGKDAKKYRGSGGMNIAILVRSTKIAEEDVDAELCDNMETSMQSTLIAPWVKTNNMRKPYQVIVFPYIKTGKGYLYAIFKRKDLKFWQGISGGGENRETPVETARREVFEEAKIDKSSRFIKLDSMTTIPVADVGNYKWEEDTFVLPEYSFGVEVFSKDLKIGKEHSAYKWLPYKKARELLRYDSNRSALSELHHRLTKKTKRR